MTRCACGTFTSGPVVVRDAALFTDLYERAGKGTWTGAKQVYRVRGADGTFERDVLALTEEPALAAGAIALLQPVMRAGTCVEAPPSLAAIRAHAMTEIAALPATVRRLHAPARYRVDEEVAPW